MDSLAAHCDKRRHSWVMWSYQLFVFDVQDRSSRSHKRSHCLFFPLWKWILISSSADTEWVTVQDLKLKSIFPPKIPAANESCQSYHSIPPFLPLPFFLFILFDCYGTVKPMNAFLKRKTLQGLAQANQNYSKSFVKLNCDNIANTISFCVRAINRVYPKRAVCFFMLFGLVSGSKHNLINHCRCIKCRRLRFARQ